LLQAVQQLLDISGEIRVVRKRQGSVILTVELTAQQAELLRDAIRNDRLKDFDLVDVRKPRKPHNSWEHLGRIASDRGSLRYFVVDQQGLLQRVRRTEIEKLWRGGVSVDELKETSKYWACTPSELRLVTVHRNRRGMPLKNYLLRLPLTDGRFTR